MEEYIDKTYKITLADGMVLSNLKLNGNNFVSDTEVTEAQFTDNLDPVVINDGETDDVHEHMALVQIAKYGEQYYFVLRDRTPDELLRIKMQADIEYLAMMSDIEL